MLFVALDGGNDVLEPRIWVHGATFSNEFVDLLPLETFHVGMIVLFQCGGTIFAVLFGLLLQISLGGRHDLLVNNCPGLFLSHVLDGMFGEKIADISDESFAIVSKSRIRHMAIPRRLDNLKSRMLHVMFEMGAIGIEVDTSEVVDKARYTWEARPHDWRRLGSMGGLMLLHIASKDCFKGNDRSDPGIRVFERRRSGSCYL